MLKCMALVEAASRELTPQRPRRVLYLIPAVLSDGGASIDANGRRRL
jgi:hypothetical protein